MARRIIKHSADVKAAALADYQNRKMTTQDIAAKHGVSSATITVWVKDAGLVLRTRGRWVQELPTPLQQKILDECAVYTYQKVAELNKMHKQSVHRIVKRWRARGLPASAPFSPGDLIVWRGKKFTVIDAGPQTGTLRDRDGRIWKNFVWAGGRIPKKIGVDTAYTLRKPKRANTKTTTESAGKTAA